MFQLILIIIFIIGDYFIIKEYYKTKKTNEELKKEIVSLSCDLENLENILYDNKGND